MNNFDRCCCVWDTNSKEKDKEVRCSVKLENAKKPEDDIQNKNNKKKAFRTNKQTKNKQKNLVKERKLTVMSNEKSPTSSMAMPVTWKKYETSFSAYQILVGWIRWSMISYCLGCMHS